MSLVIGFSFPEEAIIICDSRIGAYDKYKNPIEKSDDLRKIYTLGDHLAIGFASEDVELTLRILAKITDYAINKTKHKATYYLLERLPKVAVYEYKRLVKLNRIKPPHMEFVYVGLIDRGLYIKEKVLMDYLFSGSRSISIPRNIGKALMTMQNGYMYINPPTPVIQKQTFPIGESSGAGVYGYFVSGSGSGIKKGIESLYPTLLNTNDSQMRNFLIRDACDKYIKKSGIDSIGGSIQVLRIDKSGVTPINFINKRIYPDGTEENIYSIEFKDDGWEMTDHKNGTIKKIKQHPLLLQKTIHLKSRA
jgi:hypothetical protein